MQGTALTVSSVLAQSLLVGPAAQVKSGWQTDNHVQNTQVFAQRDEELHRADKVCSRGLKLRPRFRAARGRLFKDPSHRLRPDHCCTQVSLPALWCHKMLSGRCKDDEK